MHWVKLTISWSPWLIAWAVLAAVMGRDEQPTARSVRPSSAAASAPAAGHRRVVPLAFVVFMFRSLLTAGHSPAWARKAVARLHGRHTPAGAASSRVSESYWSQPVAGRLRP